MTKGAAFSTIVQEVSEKSNSAVLARVWRSLRGLDPPDVNARRERLAVLMPL